MYGYLEFTDPIWIYRLPVCLAEEYVSGVLEADVILFSFSFEPPESSRCPTQCGQRGCSRAASPGRTCGPSVLMAPCQSSACVVSQFRKLIPERKMGGGEERMTAWVSPPACSGPSPARLSSSAGAEEGQSCLPRAG